jgi:transcriptional regulator with PAS, ATPase and Fis domain
MQAVRAEVEHAARCHAKVLLTGESGVGKEVASRLIHYNGSRANVPLVAINCVGIPESLLESELFGHVRGAFTGASTTKKGKFALADGGTIFLDEIGTMSPTLQSKLLRVLQEREVEPLGSERTEKIDVRVIAATNRNIRQLVTDGKFQEDLFYRLNVIPIEIPPLRDRRDDIPILADFLVARLNERLKRRVVGITNPALRVLMSAPWRGNVRELENVLERAMLLTNSDSIGLDDLPAGISGTIEPLDTSDDLRHAVRAYEREHIRHVLAAARGNREEASRRLGIDASTLYRRMRDLAI